MTALPQITNSRHPLFLAHQSDWTLWRDTYNGGEEYRRRYLKRFTKRETEPEFIERMDLTPIPTFAKSAVNDIRNSIFQRMSDIVRRNGSSVYQRAVAGQDMGVDLRGSTMNSFLGQKILTELLMMGRVGVFVDMPVINGRSLADAKGKRPYLYSYAVEDILSWSCSKPEEPSEFQSVLLRDQYMKYDPRTLLPLDSEGRYRLMWIDEKTRRVNLQFYSLEGQETDRDGKPGGPVELELTRIPFVMLDIVDSLIKDVAHHQIALLNLGSSDINYAIKANFPFYTEQRDERDVGTHLKRVANEDGTATAGGQGAATTEMKVGVTHGRYYSMEAERPKFIHPSPEPLKASMELQAKLEADIRKLVNLAVLSLASRASAESKTMDNQGLEAGLSFIGLVLQAAEQRIADYWAAYEDKTISRRNVATIKYPDRYSLKTDMDRIDEADKLSDLMFQIPGRTIKKEIGKLVATTLLSGKVAVDTMETIHKEIDSAEYTTSDPDTIIAAKTAGLVGEKTASIALGFSDKEHLTAREDHIRRATEIAKAQGIARGAGDPGSRGVPDLSADPANAGKDEKEMSRNTDLKDTTKNPVRGKGRNTAEE